VNAWAVYREAIESGVSFSLNDSGKLSVGHCDDLPLLRKLRAVKSNIEGYVICGVHDELLVSVPLNPNILRCASCEKGRGGRAAYANNLPPYVPNGADGMQTVPRVTCPKGCVDRDGRGVVTRTFDTLAVDGVEIEQRVANAPHCQRCRDDRSSRQYQVKPPKCWHRWEPAPDHDGWKQCSLCNSYTRSG
jgi:hypothetical protein